MQEMIPFNKPYFSEHAMSYIKQLGQHGQYAGDGYFTKKCQTMLEGQLCAERVLLTNSCTAALEMAMILIGLKAGDEVIMPSFTFTSSANAVVLRGATPVFVDIKPTDMNIDESKIESAITERTRAILVVHYAGVGCEMNAISEIANRHNLFLIEDAAQGLNSTYMNKYLGTFGDLAAFSFHDTKNIHAGQGGALIVNNTNFIDAAEILWTKGTNRNAFLRGEVDRYTWQSVGSSFLPSELTAAVLLSQLDELDGLTVDRLMIWDKYLDYFNKFLNREDIRTPLINSEKNHNGHIFYLIFSSKKKSNDFIKHMWSCNIQVTSHYEPLHLSKYGQKIGKVSGTLHHTENISPCLIRLPIWKGINSFLPKINQACHDYFATKR